MIGDLPIEIGCVLKCRIVELKTPDFEVNLKFRRECVKIFDAEIIPTRCYVIEFRIWLSRRFGLPLSVFRLKGTSSSSVIDLYDEQLIADYALDSSVYEVETWSGWDNLIQYAIKGYPNQTVECLSQDEFIRQYQIQVVLYIAAFYGSTQLADVFLSMGARSDRPVGEVYRNTP